MINNNKFFLNEFDTVVFLGYSNIYEKLINFNQSLNLKTLVVTSSHQSKSINNKIDFKIFDKINNSFKNYINKNTKTQNTLFVSLGARYIFTKKQINNFFNNNLINFHGSRLPLDAGGGGFSWRIMREDRIDNQLIHLIDESIDGGPLIYSRANLFSKNCIIPIDFEKEYSNNFFLFYVDFIKKLKKGDNFILKPQPQYIGRYNPRLNDEKDGLIDWNMDSHDLYNFINAFETPYRGASTFINNGYKGKLYLKSVHLHGGDSSNHPFMSGLVSRHDKNWIVVSTKNKHMLLIEEVLDSKGKNIISTINVGDRFFSSLKDLNYLKKYKTKYSSNGLK